MGIHFKCPGNVGNAPTFFLPKLERLCHKCKYDWLSENQQNYFKLNGNTTGNATGNVGNAFPPPSLDLCCQMVKNWYSIEYSISHTSNDKCHKL